MHFKKEKYLKFGVLLFAFVIMSVGLYAQKKDSTALLGSVTGIVRDSTHNYALSAATIAIYNSTNSNLLAYQLSDRMGKFELDKLPVAIQLKANISYVGYKLLSLQFSIPKKGGKTDLGPLNLELATNDLQEVNISAPAPMVVRGDTIEFNASAFKLDTNAVVEDLLKKLPGVTVWSDGLITVNGKKIKTLLVEGKEFMGGDPTVALQNLPKNIVDKVQIYKENNRSDQNLIDPDLTINITLKDGHKKGYFGKLGLGYGTRKRYNGDAMISGFTNKYQFSLVGALNNTNKNTDNFTSLMRYNAFKGDGAGSTYESDFSNPGNNVARAFGGKFAYDFNDTNKLNAEAINRSTEFTQNSNDQNLTILNGVKNFSRTSTTTIKKNQHSFNESANYVYSSPQESLNITNRLSYGSYGSSSEQLENSTNLLNNQTSENLAKETNKGNDNRITFSFAYNHYGNLLKQKKYNYSLDYSYGDNRNINNSSRFINYTSSITAANRYFNRRYENETNNHSHQVKLAYNNLLKLFFPDNNVPMINLVNSVTYFLNNKISFVGDISPTNSNQVVKNTFLSNNTHYKSIKIRPSLTYSDFFHSRLTDRYDKTWGYNISSALEVFKQNNESIKFFQNIKKSYAYLMPSASIKYSNQQLNKFSKDYSAVYSNSVTYPSIEQLAPLIDSTNIWLVDAGNPKLQPSKHHQLEFIYNNTLKIKNTLNYSLRITATLTKDGFADSNAYDTLGRITQYTVNANIKDLTFSGSLQKIYKYPISQLQLRFSGQLSYGVHPNFVNEMEIRTSRINNINILNINYSYSTYFEAGIKTSFNLLNSSQNFSGKNISYISKGYGFGLSTKVYATKKITFISDIATSINKTSNFDPIKSTIWNANVGFRFFKGNQAEAKFSALDLLRQNQNTFTSITPNGILQGNRNILQQYFMVTLSYFPRYFGKNQVQPQGN
ncbi:hypothetical protein EZ428_15125 [Pedobacter frigiditerrae]|uniref:Uncharacterized protein n=1 Tax=Pedobacter frigiditerrae TaxID=2530452 RepID=A0A4V2MIJ4_9SPHI|nr:outer membrane beta-barrel protein [Pedobacter frigiditerrae]TCC90596.1 hypothetical protein EZ428_15125 [Pedobacter frigiditerrae]